MGFGDQMSDELANGRIAHAFVIIATVIVCVGIVVMILGILALAIIFFWWAGTAMIGWTQ